MSTDFRPSGTHDWHSAGYVAAWIDGDATRDAERRPLLRRVAGLVGDAAGRGRVLDVGAGYGALAAEVLDRWPQAHVTLHDYSEVMLDQAARRLGHHGTRVAQRVADMTRPGWTDALDGPFDAVVSALAIHNVDEPELMGQVYRDLFRVLRPGGALLNLDLFFPTDAGRVELYRRDPARSYNWDPRQGAADVEAHLRLLREAGFREVDCPWKDLEQALLWAVRPA